MVEYMAQRIIDGSYNYQYIVGKKPLLNDNMDMYLSAQGMQNLVIHQSIFKK
jgi:hypothetical protein